MFHSLGPSTENTQRPHELRRYDQPPRSTQPFILPGSINEYGGMPGVKAWESPPSGAGNTVWSHTASGLTSALKVCQHVCTIQIDVLWCLYHWLMFQKEHCCTKIRSNVLCEKHLWRAMAVPSADHGLAPHEVLHQKRWITLNTTEHSYQPCTGALGGTSHNAGFSEYRV